MIRKQIPFGLWICVVLAFGILRMPAADMFLKLTGVDGESTDAQHPKEIEVLSWSWGMLNTGSATGGAGKVEMQAMSLAKLLDRASPKLMLGVCSGQIFDSAVLTVRHNSGANPTDYLKITLTGVMVTTASVSGADGDVRPSETMTLTFKTVKVEYTPTNPDGSLGTPVAFGWDVAANKAL